MVMKSWDDHLERWHDFTGDLRIPWHHVETVESWSGAVRGAGEAGEAVRATWPRGIAGLVNIQKTMENGHF